ncbi:MAG: 2-oxoacid:ferredoxin oxidoreductase subunit gamma [Promethearchaeota archaeon]|nr:MAG: 2-oxoacid:ferredoxin oxidoreductase subunit gamma [Candidatus Lokiarchaeota archaeon]
MNSGKNIKNNDIKIRFCGLGGMGVILSSIILGKSAIYDDKNAVQTQSYGAEQRGSKVKSDVIISKKEMINYPVIDKADILIALSQDAFEEYFQDTKHDCMVFINSDLVHPNAEIEKLYEIPATKLAIELENKRVVNIIMLGALCKISKITSKESLIKSIIESIPEKFKEINLKAFQKGFEYFSE